MIYRVIIFVILWSLGWGVAVGRDYSLSDVLALALKNNKEISLATAELKSAAAFKREALSTALPKLNFDVGYNRNFLDNFFYVTVTDSLGQKSTNKFIVSFKNEYQLNAVLNQTLFSFGRVGNAIQGARDYDRLSRFQFEAQKQAVLTQVKKAFYQILLLQRILEVARQSEQSAQDNYANVKTKFDAGVAAEFDLLQAEVRWQNAIPETMLASKNYELAVNQLKVLLDLPETETMNLVGDLETFPARPDSLSFVQVLKQRPDYNALVWEESLQKRRIAVEFSNHLPTLSGTAIYTYGARSDAYRLENDNDNFIAGLSLNVPIFSGGYTSAQVQKARIDLEKIQTRMHIARDNFALELKNAALRMREAEQRIKAAFKSVRTAQRAFEIAETRAQNGLATQLELKDSRIFLDQAQLGYYAAIYDYLEAFFDWERAVGNVTYGMN